MDFKFLLLIFIILVILDKGLTYANIIAANKNFPQEMKGDYYKIEQNPVAKWFFQKFGLLGGSLVYAIISLITIFIFYYLFSWVFNERVALWVVFIFYGLVIFNNSYFLLKYSRIIS